MLGSAVSTRLHSDSMPQYRFKIPDKTPPGEYLLRVEQVWPRSLFNNTQVYAECAQINIVGSGGGSKQIETGQMMAINL